MGSIYKITNIVNNKHYIGQTRHDAEKTRISKHLTGNGSRVIKQAIEKYGQDAFTYEILHDGVIPEFLDTLEIEAIEKFNTIAPHGYNLTAGGEGGSPSEETRQKISDANKGKSPPNKGKPVPEVTRRKISVALKGNSRSEETRRKISETLKANPTITRGMLGKKHSEEARRKISESHKGKKQGPHSEEHRQKISDANKGRKTSEEARRKIGEAHKGKTLSEETRRKISDTKKGTTPWNKGKKGVQTAWNKGKKDVYKMSEEARRNMSKAHKGKKHSEEARRNMSKARETPDRITARELFYSLPSNMPLQEKRKRLRQRFPDTPSSTLHNWCKKFDSEA